MVGMSSMPDVRFWGAVVPAGKPTKLIVDNPDGLTEIFHLTNVALNDVKGSKHAQIRIRSPSDGKDILLGTLVPGQILQFQTDMLLEPDTEFRHTGDGEVHLSGYKSYTYGSDDEADEEDDEDEEEDSDDEDDDDEDSKLAAVAAAKAAAGRVKLEKAAQKRGKPDEVKKSSADALAAAVMAENDEDDEDEDDEDEDDEDDDEDEDDEQPAAKGPGAAKPNGLGTQALLNDPGEDDDDDEDDDYEDDVKAAPQAQRGARAAAVDDEDDDMEDEDDDDEDDDEDEDEDEEEEERPAPIRAKPQPAGKGAAAPADATGKRPVQTPATPQPAKKAKVDDKPKTAPAGPTANGKAPPKAAPPPLGADGHPASVKGDATKQYAASVRAFLKQQPSHEFKMSALGATVKRPKDSARVGELLKHYPHWFRRSGQKGDELIKLTSDGRSGK